MVGGNLAGRKPKEVFAEGRSVNPESSGGLFLVCKPCSRQKGMRVEASERKYSTREGVKPRRDNPKSGTGMK